MTRHRAVVSIVSGAVALSAIGAGAAGGTTSATLHTAKANVGGKTETILVNSRGLPLYYYPPDTARKSFVSGELAKFWPPLVSTSPTEVGARGKLSVLVGSNGHQVAYNGHFLYT